MCQGRLITIGKKEKNITITWPSDSRMCFSVTISSDNILERTESFEL